MDKRTTPAKKPAKKTLRQKAKSAADQKAKRLYGRATDFRDAGRITRGFMGVGKPKQATGFAKDFAKKVGQKRKAAQQKRKK